MNVLIVGDIHGELGRFAAIVRRAQAEFGIRAAIQVGDFGFQSDTIHAWLDAANAPFAVPVHAIDGNHEDHLWLSEIRQSCGEHPWSQAKLTWHARGSTARIGGRTFGFCGGALHVDRPQEGVEEALMGMEPRAPNWLTPAQADHAVAVFSECPPEVIITHSCPSGIGIGMQGNNLFAEPVTAWADELRLGVMSQQDCGEPTLTRLWHGLAVKPSHWLFGHFHTIHQRSVGRTLFTCTGSGDRDLVRPIILDTHSLTLTMEAPWQMAGMR